MHGLKEVSLLLDMEGRFTLVLGAIGFACVLLNLFTSRTVKGNECGETRSDEIHPLVLWNPFRSLLISVHSFFFF